MKINWPELKIPPLNLWVIGSDYNLFVKECKKQEKIKEELNKKKCKTG